MRFSVIIPTRNRCTLLTDILRSLCAQSFPSDDYEILVVDNGSTDGTKQIVEKCQSTSSVRVGYFLESNIGLHWARHTGARNAQGEILVYTDDDALAEQDFLINLDKAYRVLDADSAGGRILIKWDAEPPHWIRNYEKTLGHIDLGNPMRLLTAGEKLHGGNLSIKKARLFEIGGFNPDQVENYLIGDGETGLCRKMHANRWRIAWVPEAVVWHRQFVAQHATMADMSRRFWNNGVADAYRRYVVDRTRMSKTGILRTAARHCMTAGKDLCFAILNCVLRKERGYSFLFHFVYRLGKAHFYWKVFHSARFREIIGKDTLLQNSRRLVIS